MRNELQEKLLEMLSWFHAFCASNGIVYYILGGTMLGAVRHEGFIPWDDDIDVGLPRPHYEKLIQLLADPCGEYVLETPYSDDENYLVTYSKLYSINTTLVERTRRPLWRGVYIDVFPIDGIGNTYEESIRNYRTVDRYNLLLKLRKSVVRKELGAINAAIVATHAIPNLLLRDKELVMRIADMYKMRSFAQSQYVVVSGSPYRSKEIIEKRIWGVPTEYRFEGTTVWGPECAEEYLSNLYGDWRTLPPEEERVSRHHRIILDLHRSYLDSQTKRYLRQ